MSQLVMVKAKLTTKAKAKSRIDQCASVCKKSRSGPVSSKKFDNIPMCCECGTTIDDDTKALQCERCVINETWKCASCLELSDELYDQLICSSKNNLHWFCEKCECIALNPGAAGSDKISPMIEKLHAQNDDMVQHIVDTLAKFEQNVLDRVGAVENMLQKKAENVMLQSIESRLQKIEDRPVVMEEIQQRLEDKVDQLKQNMAQCAEVDCATLKANGPTDEDLIKAMIQQEVSRKSVEDYDVEVRKNNIILYRIPEKKSDNVSDRKTHDQTFIKDLVDAVFDMKLNEDDIEKMYRLGQWAEDKSRPLLVGLKNYDKKKHIMDNLRKLRERNIERFQGVNIAHDLHPKEREEIKQMLQRARDEHVGDGDDRQENFAFRVVGYGQRKRVIKIRKKRQGEAVSDS